MNDIRSSKTMQLILLTMAAIVAIFVLAAVAFIAFDVRLPYVGETIGALTGNAGIGAARNIYSDGPARRNGKYPEAGGI